MSNVPPLRSTEAARIEVSEMAGAIVDHLGAIKRLIDSLPAGALRDTLDNALTDMLTPALDAIVSGDAS